MNPRKILCRVRTLAARRGAVCSCSYEANPPGEKFLHHGLLELAQLGNPRLYCCNLPIHVSQYFGDFILFPERRRKAHD